VIAASAKEDSLLIKYLLPRVLTQLYPWDADPAPNLTIRLFNV
jgi:hypothetical protein